MVTVAFQHQFSITRTLEGRLFVSRLDIPIPFCDDLARNRYIKNSYTSKLSSSEYYKENDSDKGVKFGMEAKEVVAHGLSLSEQPLSLPVMKLLRWSFGDIIHACASLRNILLAEQLMLQVSQVCHLKSRTLQMLFVVCESFFFDKRN